MKIIKLYVLGLLFLSSFNVLGKECNMSTSDKSSYAIKSSIYSYLSKTELNTCKCQAGYEFDPYIPKGEFFSKGREENSFSEKPLALGGVQLQCVTPKDDSKLSTVEWAVPISVLSVMATSTAVGYYMLKRPVSPGGAPNTDTLEISNDGYLAPSNARFRVRLNNTSSEPLSVEYNEISAYDDASSTPIPPVYDDGFAGPIYNQDDPGYTDASSTQVYDDGFAGPIDNQEEPVYDEISNVISTPVEIPVNSHYELGDQLGGIINTSSNETTVRSRGLALSNTADTRLRVRSPAAEKAYNEIFGNTKLKFRPRCNTL